MSQQFTQSIIVKAQPETVYEAWSNFSNFPRFMEYVKSVEQLSGDTSRWTVQGPLNSSVTWDAELTRNEPNMRIAWSTKDNEGLVTTSGQVTFNGLPRGETEVTATFQYDVLGGDVGDVLGGLFARPEQRVEEDLRNFKKYVEA